MTALKALIAIVVSAAGALAVALGAGNNAGIGDLDAITWLGIAAAVLGSGGLVWFTENIVGVAGGVIKTIVAFLTAGVASLAAALDDGVVTQSEYIVAFIAAVTATGLVYQFRNAPPVVRQP